MAVEIYPKIFRWIFDEIENIKQQQLYLRHKNDETLSTLLQTHKDEFRELRKKFFSWRKEIEVPGFTDNEISEEEKKFNEWVNK